MDTIPHSLNLTGCTMTAETIAEALGESDVDRLVMGKGPAGQS